MKSGVKLKHIGWGLLIAILLVNGIFFTRYGPFSDFPMSAENLMHDYYVGPPQYFPTNAEDLEKLRESYYEGYEHDEHWAIYDQTVLSTLVTVDQLYWLQMFVVAMFDVIALALSLALIFYPKQD